MSYNTIRREGSKSDIERKKRLKLRPVAPNEPTPHYSHRGTPPRPKTIRRLQAQAAMGLTPFMKRIVRDDGSIVHPTKGKRSW